MSTTKQRKTATPNNGNTDGLKEMQRVHPESRANRLVALDIGESISDAMRMSFDHTRKETIEATIVNLRGIMGKAVSRAVERSGYKFTIETGTIFTRSTDILVVVVATRTE